jgi:hypothetical protein
MNFCFWIMIGYLNGRRDGLKRAERMLESAGNSKGSSELPRYRHVHTLKHGDR